MTAPTSELNHHDVPLTTTDEIKEGWAGYFEEFASPHFDTAFDEDHLQFMNTRMSQLVARASPAGSNLSPVVMFTEAEICSCFRSLKKNKAADIHNISAEHLIFASESLIPFITQLFNSIIGTHVVPTAFKMGLLLPLLKKANKPRNLPTNYRGITIISIIGKLLECAIQGRIRHLFTTAQSSQQRGFTEKVAPLYAALLVTEAIQEYKDQGQDLCVIMLDAEKAFDRVCHNNLFVKLHHLGIPDNLWNVMRDWYCGFQSQVRWCGMLSRPFDVKQGTIQGGGLSPDCFKADVNDMLLEVEHNHLGARIGTVCCSVPTCADDVAVIAPPLKSELLPIMLIIEDHSNRDRRAINSAKSAVLLYPGSRNCDLSLDVTLNNSPLPVVSEATHLGILQSPSNNLNDKRVEARISAAARTLYALFGAGLHARNGLNPASSRKIWITYVLPRLLHGSELWMLDHKHIKQLELFQRTKLRQLQGLPDRASNAAVLGLIGVWPVEAEIDRRTLNLFRNIAGAPDSVEYRIALRQLAIKNLSSNSWFTRVIKTLYKYKLPTAHAILADPPSRYRWKKTMKNQISCHWSNSIRETAANQSSMKCVSHSSLSIGFPALIWSGAIASTRETQKAYVKVKMLTGTYRLQAHEAKFNKNKFNANIYVCNVYFVPSRSRRPWSFPPEVFRP